MTVETSVTGTITVPKASEIDQWKPTTAPQFAHRPSDNNTSETGIVWFAQEGHSLLTVANSNLNDIRFIQYLARVPGVQELVFMAG